MGSSSLQNGKQVDLRLSSYEKHLLRHADEAARRDDLVWLLDRIKDLPSPQKEESFVRYVLMLDQPYLNAA